MSTELYYHCILKGRYFDPTPLLADKDIIVEDYHCSDGVGKVECAKDTSCDLGYIRFRGKSNLLIDFLEHCENSGVLRQAFLGVADRELSLHFEYTYEPNFEFASNWELTPNEINKIYSLGLVLAISSSVRKEDAKDYWRKPTQSFEYQLLHGRKSE